MQVERVYKRLAGVVLAVSAALPRGPCSEGPLNLAPRTLSEPAAVALQVRDLRDLVLAETLEQVVDSAVLPLHLGTPATSDTGRRT
jgi:hypothetical protein